MHDNIHHTQTPRGIISLLALILMATVTATAVGAAAVILAEIRQTESLDQAITSVYAAEAGLEDGLYVVKIKRSIATLEETQNLLRNPLFRAGLPNTSVWARNSAVENRFFLSSLRADKTAHLDIFNPDYPANPGASGIESLWINWSVNCNELVELETTMLTWIEENGVITFNPSTQRVFKQTKACNQTPPALACDENYILSNIDGVDIFPDQPYRFSFRLLVPLNSSCAAEDLLITAYDVESPAALPVEQRPLHYVPIPTRIEIKATGSFARSKQALTASVPWKTPVSGLLGFVVFSDEGITK